MPKIKVSGKDSVVVKAKLKGNEIINQNELSVLSPNALYEFLPPIADSAKALEFRVGNAVPVSQYISGGIEKINFFNIILRLLDALYVAETRNLNVNNICLDLDMIYFYPATSGLGLIYLPINEAAFQNNLFMPFYNIAGAARLNYDDGTCADFTNYLKGLNAFSISEFLNFIESRIPNLIASTPGLAINEGVQPSVSQDFDETVVLNENMAGAMVGFASAPEDTVILGANNAFQAVPQDMPNDFVPYDAPIGMNDQTMPLSENDMAAYGIQPPAEMPNDFVPYDAPIGMNDQTMPLSENDMAAYGAGVQSNEQFNSPAPDFNTFENSVPQKTHNGINGNVIDLSLPTGNEPQVFNAPAASPVQPMYNEPVGVPVEPIAQPTVSEPVAIPVKPIISDEAEAPVQPVAEQIVNGPIGVPVEPIAQPVASEPIGVPIEPIAPPVASEPVGIPVEPIAPPVASEPIGVPVEPIAQPVASEPVGVPVEPIAQPVASEPVGVPVEPVTEEETVVINNAEPVNESPSGADFKPFDIPEEMYGKTMPLDDFDLPLEAMFNKEQEPKLHARIRLWSNDKHYDMRGTELRVGSDSASNDVVIANKNVSRNHLTISLIKGKFFVRDNGSTNGTLLNGARLQPGTEVHINNGDRLVAANEIMDFEIVEA